MVPKRVEVALWSCEGWRERGAGASGLEAQAQATLGQCCPLSFPVAATPTTSLVSIHHSTTSSSILPFFFASSPMLQPQPRPPLSATHTDTLECCLPLLPLCAFLFPSTYQLPKTNTRLLLSCAP